MNKIYGGVYDAENEIFVESFGGEYKDGDFECNAYGLQVGDLVIDNIKPEVFAALARIMIEHLENNGRKI